MRLERVGDKVSLWAIVFIAGYITCASVNHLSFMPWLWSQQKELVVAKKVVIPKLASEAGCEHQRANAATIVAKEVIVSAKANSSAGLTTDAIPQDCVHEKLPKLK